MKRIFVLAVAAIFAAGTAMADTTVIDISGIFSNGFQGDPSNEVLNIDLGGEASIDSISYDVTIETIDLSWLEETSFQIDADGGSTGVVSPGAGDDFSGTATYAGAAPAGFSSSDGQLSIEFFEIDFDDNVNAADAQYLSGSTITIDFTPSNAIPEPSTFGLIALAGLGLVRRRR